MPAPTSLPSGNHLRDLVVGLLLRDGSNAHLVDTLLRAESYKALLPEVALQEMGYSIQSYVDQCIVRLLSSAVPNSQHLAIAKAFGEIFTTNFDECFEKSGAVKVYHVHGSVRSPETMQNRLWRLGHTAERELDKLREIIEQRPIFVVGYSFRDFDIARIFHSAKKAKTFYLSHTGEIPRNLYSIPGEVICASGPIDTILPLVPLEENAHQFTPMIKQPPNSLKAMALLYLFNASGMLDEVESTFDFYRGKMRGRLRLRAIALLAETLRTAQNFPRAHTLCKRAIKSRTCSTLKNLDTQSYLLTVLALCEHEGFRDIPSARRHLLLALNTINIYGRRSVDQSIATRVAVWRAKIANNIANLERDCGRIKRAKFLYEFSIRIKEEHGEEGSVAISRSNLSVLQIGLEELLQAATSLHGVVDAMLKSPDLYVLRTALYDNTIALSKLANLDTAHWLFGEVDLRELENTVSKPLGNRIGLDSVLRHLNQLDVILAQLTNRHAPKNSDTL